MLPKKTLFASLFLVVLLIACGGTGNGNPDGGQNPTSFSVGGIVTGLTAEGLVLQNNGMDNMGVPSGSTGFTFPTRLSNFASYAVTVLQSPAGVTCQVVAGTGSGTIPSANVTSVQVTCTPNPVNKWTWVAGGYETGGAGVYGTPGSPASGNTPGARYGSASWVDAAGNLWLFGGTPNGSALMFNDLWKFNGTNWISISGDGTTNAPGVYGTMGVAAANNIPGARFFATSWKDGAGNFWLFGGKGYDGSGNHGTLNDLWKFNGTQWTWVSGTDTANAAASYGTKGIPDAGNMPGTRERAIGWFDVAGNAWLFGGLSASNSTLNDLWKFDGANWTWVSGSTSGNAPGVYGAKGTANSANTPGARQDSVSWTDSQGHLWLYGGWGYDGSGTHSDLNDLWKFDGANWTWVTGSATGNTAANYGTIGVTLSTNDPGSRENAVSWKDGQGNFWLMSGTSGQNVGELNDLWKFDGTNWTWISGSKTTGSHGTYGAKGVAGAAYIPGGRDSAAAWVDTAGNLWLFGGWGFGATTGDSKLNDLWRYQP